MKTQFLVIGISWGVLIGGIAAWLLISYCETIRALVATIIERWRR